MAIAPLRQRASQEIRCIRRAASTSRVTADRDGSCVKSSTSRRSLRVGGNWSAIARLTLQPWLLYMNRIGMVSTSGQDARARRRAEHRGALVRVSQIRDLRLCCVHG